MTGDLPNMTAVPHGEIASDPSKKISIVIPAFNAAETLSDALTSVISQTMKSWEAIIVDDGSTDRTAQIAADYAAKDHRIRLIQQSHQGESGARNAGVSRAQFDWLLFLDADDWISPTHLQTMTQKLFSNPGLDAVICRSARVTPDGTLIPERFFVPAGDLFPILARRAAFNVHACIVRKSLVEAVGRFDTSLERMPDWDLWQRIARMGALFEQVDEVLAFYRMRPDSISLDAYEVLRDGLRVLKTGHSLDSRVNNPHPNHVNGMPASGFDSEQFYFLAWCAGLLLGQGKEPQVALMNLIHKEGPAVLFANAIAQCIFEAALLPICRPPHAWEDLWSQIHKQVKSFLSALETQAEIPGLASEAEYELKILVLKHSKTWGPILSKYEAELETLEVVNRSLTKAKDDWVEIAEQRGLVIQQQTSNLDQLLMHIESLQNENATLKREKEEAQILAESKDKELTALTLLVEESRILSQRKSQELEVIAGHLNEANQALQAKGEEIRLLEETMVELRKTTDLMTNEVAAMRNMLEIRDRHLQELRDKIEEKERDLHNLRETKRSLETEIINLQKLADQRKARYLHLRTQLPVRAGIKTGILKKYDL